MRMSKYMVMLAITVLFAACLKDEGNYDYIKLPDFRIDTVGQQTLFEVQQSLTPLVIHPKLVFDGDEADLTYLWRLYGGENKFDTLSFERVLNAPISRPAGVTYTVELQVTKKSNNLSTLMRYQVSVVSALSSGWLVAYEKDGGTDVDVIRAPEFISGVRDTVIRNVFSKANGSALPGTPVSVLYLSTTLSYLYTSETGVKLQNTDFQKVQNFNQIFVGSVPQTIKPEGFWPGTFYRGALINDGDVYWMDSDVLIARVIVDDKGYEAAPFVYYNYAKFGGFYDQLNMRFLTIEQYSSQAGKYANAASSARFNLNNIGKKLLFIERGFGATSNDPHKYAFFKDVTGNGRYLYVISTSTPANPDIAAINISAAPNISDARFYAVGNLGPCAFYATSGTVYNFIIDYSGNTISSPVAGFKAPAGEEITCMKLFKGQGTTSGVGSINTANESKFMYVATWNGSEARVYLLGVNVTSGELTSPLKTWAVGGKVGDMNYKQN